MKPVGRSGYVVFSLLLTGAVAAGGPSAVESGAETNHIKAKGPARQVLCLMYHRFVDDATYSSLPAGERVYCISESNFDRQMGLLRGAGYQSIRLGDVPPFVHGKPLDPARPVLITIDDGCRSALSMAAPILRKHGLTAVLFVTTDATAYVFGGSEPATAAGPGHSAVPAQSAASPKRHDPRLSNAELRAWADMGFEIGSHGVTHRPLTELDDTALSAELRDSRRSLERAIHQPVTVLSLPRGRANRRVRQFAAKAGYSMVFTSRRDRIVSGNDVLSLPRRSISGRWSERKFRSLLEDTANREADTGTGRSPSGQRALHSRRD